MTTHDERYSHGHHESVLRSHTWRTVENSAAYLAPHLAPSLSLLDVGSGPGTITVDFAARLGEGRVVGIDRSAEIVAQATALAEAQEQTNVEFLEADVYALPFDDDTFDIVHAHQVLQHLGDPVAALREMRRVAKKGGLVAVRDVDYRGSLWAPANPGLEKWLDVYERNARANGGEPDAGRHLRSWVLQAGFTDVTATATAWCFASDAERTWWGDSWAARTLESQFYGDVLEHGIATDADLQEIAAGWIAWRDAPDGWLSMLHAEILATA